MSFAYFAVHDPVFPPANPTIALVASESSAGLSKTPQTNEALEVTRGNVICHSQDRDEVYRQAVALRPKRSAILYTGRMPEDTAIVL